MNDKWIKINGSDIRKLGVKVLRLPDITIAEELVNEYNIPGKNEPLIERTGEFLPYTLIAELFYSGDNPDKVLDKISKATSVVFSNMPQYAFDCIVSEKIEIPRRISNWYTFVIPFKCQPLKRESSETFYTGSSIVFENKGTVDCYPRIELPVSMNKFEVSIVDRFNGTGEFAGLYGLELRFNGSDRGCLTTSWPDNFIEYELINATVKGTPTFSTLLLENVSDDTICRIYNDHAFSYDVRIEFNDYLFSYSELATSEEIGGNDSATFGFFSYNQPIFVKFRLPNEFIDYNAYNLSVERVETKFDCYFFLYDVNENSELEIIYKHSDYPIEVSQVRKLIAYPGDNIIYINENEKMMIERNFLSDSVYGDYKLNIDSNLGLIYTSINFELQAVSSGKFLSVKPGEVVSINSGIRDMIVYPNFRWR